MKLKEFCSIDLAEKAYFELHKLLESNNLLENNNNNTEYAKFVEMEKQQCINVSSLNQTDDYYPLYLNSAPVATFIKGQYFKKPGKFIKMENDRIIFSDEIGLSVKFPLDRDMVDGRIDLFVFDTFQNLNHFLTALHLKFADWNIQVKSVII